jgi:hypothetical protein
MYTMISGNYRTSFLNLKDSPSTILGSVRLGATVLYSRVYLKALNPPGGAISSVKYPVKCEFDSFVAYAHLCHTTAQEHPKLEEAS